MCKEIDAVFYENTLTEVFQNFEERILMCMDDEGHHLRSYLKEIMKLGNLQVVLE